MKILQINTTVNSGSVGRAVEMIGQSLIKAGHESYIGYSCDNRPSESKLIKIGNNWDRKVHGLKTRLFDRHGFSSRVATQKFVETVKEINPDVIHLNNIHGYYLNIEVLFNYLKSTNKSIVWTLYDCWPFTGHCAMFDFVGCDKWKVQCCSCPIRDKYPASWVFDRSHSNYRVKRKLFTGLQCCVVVTPSSWLKERVEESFLKDYPVQVIYNGVDTEVFKPKPDSKLIKKRYRVSGKKIILGVASIWDRRKGLKDLIRLSSEISNNEIVMVVGLSKKQLKNLPKKIVGIERTESVEDLADLYSAADVLVNPTYADNFPLVNIEALACSTPVITYNTGGSPEAVDEDTGIVVEKGDIDGLLEAVRFILAKGKDFYASKCRSRALKLYNKEDRNKDYLKLYNGLLG